MKTIKNLITLLNLTLGVLQVYECTEKFIRNRKEKREKIKTEENQA